MSDFEIPQLQVGRYLDLLKRRRWQLIPAGLIGLAVGLVVAWMIPRYYEANMVVRIRPTQAPGSFRGEDPFLEEIRAARITVRSYPLVREAMLQLGWLTDSEVHDSGARLRVKVQDVISRLKVTDLHKGEPGRGSALLRIGYRDLDKDRVAKMANTVGEFYMEGEYTAIIAVGKQQLENLVDQRSRKLQEHRSYSDKLRTFLEDNSLDPEVEGINAETTKAAEAARLEGEIAEIDEELKATEFAATKFRDRLAELPPRIEIPFTQNSALLALLGPIDQQILFDQFKLNAYTRANPAYSAIELRLAEMRARRQALVTKLMADGLMTQVNPRWATTTDKLDTLTMSIDALRSKRAGKAVRHERLVLFTKELPRLQLQRAELTQRVLLAQTEYEAAKAAYDIKEAQVTGQELNKNSVISTQSKAWTPLEPTYPNKTFVALLGGILGIAVAIGLILLLDLLQPTFKSLDEIGRALPVPVLGAVSHFELAEDRAAAAARRFKIMLLVGVALTFLGSIFALYFLDPVRLPEWVRGALDKVFAAKAK